MSARRSAWLHRDRGALVAIIDLQERLVPVMHESDHVVDRVRVLCQGATVLGVACMATEQSPTKLGPTVPALAPLLPRRVAKTSFSAARAIEASGETVSGRDVVIAGCEAHVCVLQTALDLQDAGARVTVVRDAVASRRTIDRDVAIGRLQASGVQIATVESVLFEWTGDADDAAFRQISRLVK